MSSSSKELHEFGDGDGSDWDNCSWCDSTDDISLSKRQDTRKLLGKIIFLLLKVKFLSLTHTTTGHFKVSFLEKKISRGHTTEYRNNMQINSWIWGGGLNKTLFIVSPTTLHWFPNSLRKLRGFNIDKPEGALDDSAS